MKLSMEKLFGEDYRKVSKEIALRIEADPAEIYDALRVFVEGYLPQALTEMGENYRKNPEVLRVCEHWKTVTGKKIVSAGSKWVATRLGLLKQSRNKVNPMTTEEMIAAIDRYRKSTDFKYGRYGWELVSFFNEDKAHVENFLEDGDSETAAPTEGDLPSTDPRTIQRLNETTENWRRSND